jgi:hypothetical protein
MLDGLAEGEGIPGIQVFAPFLPPTPVVYSYVGGGLPGGTPSSGGYSSGPIPEIVVTAYKDWATKNNKNRNLGTWIEFVSNVLPGMTTQLCGGSGCHSNVGPSPSPTPPVVFPKDDGTPGDNQRQNKQVKDVANQLGLTKDQQRQLHDEISGENLTYQEILQRAKDMFGK